MLGKCEKLQKKVSSLRLSVLLEHLGSHWRDFHEILNRIIFRKSLEEVQVSLQTDKKQILYMKTNIDF